MRTHRIGLAELTIAEAGERLRAGAAVLLPLGSQEDQGPHAPMGDFLCAQRLSERIADAAIAAGYDTLVAPVLPFGGRDVFGSRIGGITLNQETLRLVLRDMLACLLRHGVTRLVVVNGHGGNAQAVHDVTQSIWLEQRVLIPCLHPWKIAAGLLPELIGPELARRSTGHGADPLTSIAMHLVPSLIRHDLLAPMPSTERHVDGLPITGFGTATLAGVEIAVPIEIGDSAVTADPRLCSADTGALLVERLVAAGAALIAQRCAPP